MTAPKHEGMLVSILAALTLTVAQATAQPAPAPKATPDTPIYVGNPATHFTVEKRIQGFDPDGKARLLLVAHFFDAQNNPTTILANSDLSWLADRGHVQWQNRMRYGSPAALVLVDTEGPIHVTVRANQPAIGSVAVFTDTRAWQQPRTVAKALGPHMVQIGWFPQALAGVRIVRVDGNDKRTVLANLPRGTSTYRDTGVTPGKHYRYTISDIDGTFALPVVAVPAELPPTGVAMASGKGMWLYWSVNPLDPNYWGKLDARKIVAQAAKAKLQYVEIRTAYGAQWLIPPDAKPTIDAIIDGLAAHGIVPMGWSVPREVTFEDLSASLRTAEYRTTKGTPLQGLAIDLERGDDFLGADPNGLDGLWMYEKYLREAVGPKYLIVATVEDPFFEHLDNTKYPYQKIALYADVLQPMSYWRMMRRQPTTPDQVRAFLPQVYAKLIAQSGRTLPISIGGQTTAEGRNGYPPAAEITASLEASKAAGAIGECFFDWYGTQPYQWDALAAYTW
jgi:hypothetical protein